MFYQERYCDPIPYLMRKLSTIQSKVDWDSFIKIFQDVDIKLPNYTTIYQIFEEEILTLQSFCEGAITYPTDFGSCNDVSTSFEGTIIVLRGSAQIQYELPKALNENIVSGQIHNIKSDEYFAQIFKIELAPGTIAIFDQVFRKPQKILRFNVEVLNGGKNIIHTITDAKTAPV